jgi:hypothetical protein
MLRYVESPADGSLDFTGQAMGEALLVPTQFADGLFAAKAERQYAQNMPTAMKPILICGASFVG